MFHILNICQNSLFSFTFLNILLTFHKVIVKDGRGFQVNTTGMTGVYRSPTAIDWDTVKCNTKDKGKGLSRNDPLLCILRTSRVATGWILSPNPVERLKLWVGLIVMPDDVTFLTSVAN